MDRRFFKECPLRRFRLIKTFHLRCRMVLRGTKLGSRGFHMQHANVKILEQLYANFAKGDMGAVLAAFQDPRKKQDRGKVYKRKFRLCEIERIVVRYI